MGKIYGCDIGAKFIILHDGKNFYQIKDHKDLQEIRDLGLTENDIVVLEQTGAYGIRWAEIFTSIGLKVYIADGKDFKNFRMAFSKKKDDVIDAYYLRKYYKEKKHKCRPYNPIQTHLRALIRQHIRNEKDLTKHINRLKQYLAVIFPLKDYHLKPRSTFIKLLPEIEKQLVQSPHALNNLALTELKKVLLTLTENKALEEEITSIAKHHKDYEILNTFPIGDIQIATIIAYSYNIKDFPNKDAFIAYVLMGSNLEQSGTSIYKVKTDKARTEVKGLFYTLFMQAHRKTANWTHPLNPLALHVKTLVNTSYNYKKRYIKFLSRFLELIYIARKHNLTFKEAVDHKINLLLQEQQNILKKPDQISTYKAYKLSRIKAVIETLEQIKTYIKQAQRKDISKTSKKRGRASSLYVSKKQQEQEEKQNETTTKNKQNTANKISPDKSKRKTQLQPNPKTDKSSNRRTSNISGKVHINRESNTTNKTLPDNQNQEQDIYTQQNKNSNKSESNIYKVT